MTEMEEATADYKRQLENYESMSLQVLQADQSLLEMQQVQDRLRLDLEVAKNRLVLAAIQ